MWLFVMSFWAIGFVSSLKYLFVVSYNKQQTDWLQPGRVSMLLSFVMHTMTTIIPLLFVLKIRDVSPPLSLRRGLAVYNLKKTIISYPPCG